MKLEYKHLLPADFADDSRVWIYQSNRLFSVQEALKMEDVLNVFVEKWNSHGTPVKGYANLLFGQFIVLMADETATGVSGCSTDSSVRMIKQFEEMFGVSLFERQLLAFLVKDKVQLIPMSQLSYAVQNNFIDGKTLYFNNTVTTRKQLLEDWIVPAGRSWLQNKVSFSGATA